MKHRNLLLAATVLASSIGLAGLGISHAQSTDTSTTTTDSAVDTAVTATATTTSNTTTTPYRGGHHGRDLSEQATRFNMTVADLQAALDAGTPMYQIAAEHGVTYSSEKTQRLADLKTRLDDMVKVKYMTQAEADAVYNEAKDSAMIGRLGGGGPHGPR